MNFDELQSALKTRLATNTTLAGIDTFIELDPLATPDELAAQDNLFALATAQRGLAISILSPYGQPADVVYGASAWAMTVPVAVSENSEINRSTADPTATPPTNPHRLAPAAVQQLIISTLIGPWKFSRESRIARPTLGDDGLVHYYLLPEFIVKVS